MSSVQITGIDATIENLQMLMSKAKQKAFLQRLAEKGIKVADARFSNAKYDGINDVLPVTLNWLSDNEVELIASGNSVCFIEFGSGVYYEEDYEGRPSELAPIGTYGKGNGSKDWWLFKDNGGSGTKFEKKEGLIITHGNPPAKAMYEARSEMEKNIEKIAREVLFK